MTVSELIAHLRWLQQEHGDLKVICWRYSDYQFFETDEVTVVRVKSVPGSSGEWMRQVHLTEADDGEPMVHFAGN